MFLNYETDINNVCSAGLASQERPSRLGDELRIWALRVGCIQRATGSWPTTAAADSVTGSDDVRLSILDQSPIPDGSSAPEALAATLELAKLADRLGYARYWL